MATLQAADTTNTNSIADRAIAFALAQVGKPYRWGAIGPDAYDCSGLIQTSYKHAGLKLTRTTYTMIHQGQSVSRSQLAPGDLIFPNPGHVQLYIGGGKVVEAPEAGIPVRVVPIWGFWQARRVTAPGIGSVAGGTAGSSVAGNGASGFSNPVTDTLNGAGDAISWITTAHNWLRIGEFIAGVIVLFTAIASITKGAQ
jgi:hypothetical protein